MPTDPPSQNAPSSRQPKRRRSNSGDSLTEDQPRGEDGRYTRRRSHTVQRDQAEEPKFKASMAQARAQLAADTQRAQARDASKATPVSVPRANKNKGKTKEKPPKPLKCLILWPWAPGDGPKEPFPLNSANMAKLAACKLLVYCSPENESLFLDPSLTVEQQEKWFLDHFQIPAEWLSLHYNNGYGMIFPDSHVLLFPGKRQDSIVVSLAGDKKRFDGKFAYNLIRPNGCLLYCTGFTIPEEEWAQFNPHYELETTENEGPSNRKRGGKGKGKAKECHVESDADKSGSDDDSHTVSDPPSPQGPPTPTGVHHDDDEYYNPGPSQYYNYQQPLPFEDTQLPIDEDQEDTIALRRPRRHLTPHPSPPRSPTPFPVSPPRPSRALSLSPEPRTSHIHDVIDLTGSTVTPDNVEIDDELPPYSTTDPNPSSSLLPDLLASLPPIPPILRPSPFI
ncbi:hypothetical protein SISSUDRAFT_1067997 [Sistotremastrum suecicum HHB10207 ss-3]|uniref:Uncharacterized protein n=1 Tax=Sistotremastrum suecicum HHB10207 ss-3 TaxID=1314776 RepID=A0A165WI84_9AGAM|nr:hypothetical protein SISSUDRAFT_1067997 [Sistotremastrum suecicum HHB10207 ss-3]